MPPAKKATTRRTTAKPKTFDDKRKALLAKRGESRWDFDAYGRTWSVKRPNIALVGELEDAETIGAFTAYLVAHVDESERQDFIDALKNDEELDLDIIQLLAEDMQRVVYAGIPT